MGESPAYWPLDDWCTGFRNLLSHLHLEKVHIFGAALGGFLAQKFAEFTRPCPRVASLILCNSFTDTSVFKFSEQAPILWLMPNPMLKGMVMNGLTEQDGNMDIAIATAGERGRLQVLPPRKTRSFKNRRKFSIFKQN